MKSVWTPAHKSSIKVSPGLTIGCVFVNGYTPASSKSNKYGPPAPPVISIIICPSQDPKLGRSPIHVASLWP